MMHGRAIRIRSTGLALALLALAWAAPAQAQSEPFAADAVAEAVRARGYACEHAVSAVHEAAPSRPDEQVWRLTCTERSYRVRFMGDEGPKVEPLDAN